MERSRRAVSLTAVTAFERINFCLSPDNMTQVTYSACLQVHTRFPHSALDIVEFTIIRVLSDRRRM